MLLDNVHKEWKPILFNFIYNNSSIKKLFEEILPNISYQPKKEDVFNVFNMNPNKIKVVILGQDQK